MVHSALVVVTPPVRQPCPETANQARPASQVIEAAEEDSCSSLSYECRRSYCRPANWYTVGFMKLVKIWALLPQVRTTGTLLPKTGSVQKAACHWYCYPLPLTVNTPYMTVSAFAVQNTWSMLHPDGPHVLLKQTKTIHVNEPLVAHETSSTQELRVYE